MNYSPKGMRIWDAWYMNTGSAIHMYHLQRRRTEDPALLAAHDELGHAVTTDLINWEERPTAFGPDARNPHDDRQPWTGSNVWHEGKGYLFYTMRGSATQTKVQAIGLATTENPDRWTRHGNNPVIRPDPRWYAAADAPVPGLIDCRDLFVLKDPSGQGWLGFYATRQPGEELPETSVIACVHSMDLIHWEHRPPAFAPKKYACIEVPEVFELNGRWYMVCLTGNWYGNRGIFDDPNLVNGTIWAIADRPEGPYVEVGDHALVAAKTTGPISLRTTTLNGHRYALYTDRERSDRTDHGSMVFGTISTPKLLATDGDQLLAKYSPLIESKVTGELIGARAALQPRTNEIWGQIWQIPSARWELDSTVRGECRTGWGVLPLTCKAESFIFEADVTLETALAAGLVTRITGRSSGAVIAIEAGEHPAVFYAAAPAFDWEERRRTDIRRGTTYHLRVVNRLEHVEIYVNDVLRLAFSRYTGIGGEVGLFVDRGIARFDNICLRTLDVRLPE